MGPLKGRGLDFNDRGALGITGAISLRSGGQLARVGVVFGGPSPEHDVSILTALQALRGFANVPNIGELHAFYWAKNGEWFEVPSNLEAASFLQAQPAGAVPLKVVCGPGGGFVAQRGGRFAAKEQLVEVDVILVCCHGGPGEDGSLQGMLDLMQIPYTGPNAAGAMIGMDKLVFSALAASAWLQMLPRVPLYEGSAPPGFPGPYIIKPRFGGSSIGIEVVADIETARARLRVNPHFKRGAVLEPYQPELFDLQLAVRVYPDLQLSAIEKPLRTRAGGEILAYADKYVGPEGMTTAPRELPARISPELERQIRTVAPEVANLVGVRGVARIDFLSDGDALYVNEVNTIPGSLARYLWIDPSLQFARLLLDLLSEAIARPSTAFSVAGSDGTVLRGAGPIGGKLG